MDYSNCPVCLKEIDYPDPREPIGPDNCWVTFVPMDKDENLDEYFDDLYCVDLHEACEEEYIRKNNIFHCDICERCGYKNNNNSICLYEHNKCVYKQPMYDDTIIVKKTLKFSCYVFESEVNDNIIHKPFQMEDDQPYHVNTYHKKCVPEFICEICNEGFDENNYKDIIIDFDHKAYCTKKYHIECCEKIKNLCFCKKALLRTCNRCHKHSYRCFNYYETDHTQFIELISELYPDTELVRTFDTDSDYEEEEWGEDYYCKKCTRIRQY